ATADNHELTPTDRTESACVGAGVCHLAVGGLGYRNVPGSLQEGRRAEATRIEGVGNDGECVSCRQPTTDRKNPGMHGDGIPEKRLWMKDRDREIARGQDCRFGLLCADMLIEQ